MKQLPLYICTVFCLVLFSGNAFAQSGNKSKAKGKTKAETVTVPKKTVRGAATPQELGQYVFAALQENNFDAIAQYFPTEADITKTESRTPDEDLQLILEDQQPASIQDTFRQDFEELQKKSIEQGISFQQLNLMEAQAGAPMKANRLMPVNLLLSNRNNETITIAFETLKINGRYFLFQHIGVKQAQ